MLVLTRRHGETLIIGDNIEVSILSTNGKQVRLGIQAPKDISVHRKEVYLKILAKKAKEEDQS